VGWSLASLVVLLLVLVTVPGCGSRGPLDINVIEPVTLDGAIDNFVPVNDGSSLDTAAEDATPEAMPDVAPGDAGRDTGGGPLMCLTCIQQQCGMQVFACFQNTTCRTTLQCVLTTCLGGGGGINPQCALMCANGDITALQDILNIVTCIGTNCGQSCVGVLPGGGGMGDGG
jgi:hypothetical protein